MTTASTRVFALLGDPVGHSLSPEIQNAALQAAGLDGIYVALRCTRADVGGLLRGIARAGGGGNVTVPHKGEAAAALDEPSDLVRRTGACNTFWLEGDRVLGDNTDVPGFRGALRQVAGGSVEGARVLLLGAGGSARAAVVGLVEEGVASIVIRNRTLARAETLASELGEGIARGEGLGGESGGDLGGDPGDDSYDLVVNTTSLGLRDDDPLPVDLTGPPRPKAVLDLVYRPQETALVHRARDLGIAAADGGEMLVRQGAEAFERWWGRDAPLDDMRDALRARRTGSR